MNSPYGRFAMVDTKHDVKTVSSKDMVHDKPSRDYTRLVRTGGLEDVNSPITYSACGQVTYRSKRGHVNIEPQQLGGACTAGARAIMHLIGGEQLLCKTVQEQQRENCQVYYQDTDSYYATITLSRKWKTKGLFGNALGQMKNDTVKKSDGCGVLGYFITKKVKVYFARDLQKGKWGELLNSRSKESAEKLGPAMRWNFY